MPLTALVVLFGIMLAMPLPGAQEQVPSGPSAPTPGTLLAAPNASYVRTGVTINYRTLGRGDDVLLVHGYGDRLEMWAGLAEVLAKTHRVIAVDVRGFGGSSKPAGVSAYGREMVLDLVGLLDHLQVRRTHVVGYSMGAVLGMTLATMAPERVWTLSLLGLGYWEDAGETRRVLAPFIADMEAGKGMGRFLQFIVPTLGDKDAAEFSRLIYADSNPTALVDILKSFPAAGPDVPRFPAMRIPAVAIVGTGDVELRPLSVRFAKAWPNARLVELPGVDHITVTTSPDAWREVVAHLAR